MKSLFEESTYHELMRRIDALTENSKPLWGKMSVGQMLWHCQIPMRLAVKNKKYEKRANPLVKLLLHKSMYSDKPYRKNLPTTKFARAKEEKDFGTEQTVLRDLVSALYEVRERTDWNPHPIFGEFTPEQWGKMSFKHLDHHLRQFGV